MNTESRVRGYLLTEASLNLFEKKKSELGLSLEEIAGKADMSVDSVKRLFNPHKGTGVQKDTIRAVAKALEINSEDIKLTASKDVAQKVSSESARVLSQRILSNINVSGSLKIGKFLQKASGGSSVEQVALHNVLAENIELGSVTQER